MPQWPLIFVLLFLVVIDKKISSHLNLKRNFEQFAQSKVTVLQNISNLIQHVKQTKLNLKDCYNANIYDKEVDIFQVDMLDLLHHFVKENKELFINEKVKERIEIFFKNIHTLMHLIVECTRRPAKKRTKLGVTSLAALSDKEYKSMFVSFPEGLSNLSSSEDCSEFFNYDKPIPESFDWRDKGVVNEIRKQGTCGSCYIFTSISTTESAYMIKHGSESKVRFSEQAVLNCIDRLNPCAGGLIDEVWDHLKLFGLTEAEEAPYRGKQEICLKYPHVAAKIEGYCLRTHGLTDKQIQMLLLQKGPTVAGIATDSDELEHLTGPFHSDCGTKLKHTVSIVGWTPEYWIAKNTWGVNWGVNGYLYLDRTTPNKCGINTLSGAVWTN